MDLIEALHTRRAVRSFTDEPVAQSTLATLIDAAVLTPSAMNVQPWSFFVVSDAKRLHELAVHAKQFARSAMPKGSPLAAHLADPQFEMFHGAAALVVVCATDATTQSAEDCCLAAYTLMLAAHGDGLGTCWIGLSRPWLNQVSVKEGLGIPADLHPVAPIVIGHPRVQPPATPRRPAQVIWAA